MFSVRSLGAIAFAISHAVSAAASFPEPLFFFNLTRDEFLLKRWEHKREGQSMLSKRELKGLEQLNTNQFIRNLIEEQSQHCLHRFGEDMRVVRSQCTKTVVNKWPTMSIYCKIYPEEPNIRPRHSSKSCRKNQVCRMEQFYNFSGRRASLAFCEDVIEVNEKPGPEVEIPPVYEGSKSIPEQQWVPGIYDTHYEMADHIAGVKASWEYRGHYANGWNFIHGSEGKTTSFGCLGCPAGTLYVETVGFKSRAQGFTVPAHLL